MSASRTGEGGDLLNRAAALLGARAQRNVPIGALTTYRVGGAAELYVEACSEGDLEALSAVVSETALEVLVLGRGSNLLVADAGWPGLCVRLGAGFSEIEVIGAEVVAGAAVPYPVLARQTAAAGLSGMEWAVGIPGSVGGAVRMNAGGHGAETSETLVACRIIDLGSGADAWHAAAGLGLSYRYSSIGAEQLVAEARYSLAAGDPAESSAAISEIVRWRREHQPGGQNAGSVFTNPPAASAGQLIDEAGLKGFRIGSAAVSTKHGNFIQADASGSADDVRKVIEAVRVLVAERLGVELAVELKMVGFGSPDRPGSAAPAGSVEPLVSSPAPALDRVGRGGGPHG